jgi:hypothetical protein
MSRLLKYLLAVVAIGVILTLVVSGAGTEQSFANWTNYYYPGGGFFINATHINYTIPQYDPSNFTYQIEVWNQDLTTLIYGPFVITSPKGKMAFSLNSLPNNPTIIILRARNKDSIQNGGTHWCNKVTNRSHWVYIEEIGEYQCPISFTVDVIVVQNTNTYPVRIKIMDDLRRWTPYRNESIPGASWKARWKADGL